MMGTERLKEFIDEVVDETFRRLSVVYKNNREYNKQNGPNKLTIGKSRLLFPFYRSSAEVRVSEQELRFLFVETFNECCAASQQELFYSIETPTKDCYSGFATGTPKRDKKGRSAAFDLVIFNSAGQRVCLIEFKANNAKDSDHKKDFMKLNNPEEGNEIVLRYFIEVLQSYNTGTGKSLKEKLAVNADIKAEFRCFILEEESILFADEKTGEFRIRKLV